MKAQNVRRIAYVVLLAYFALGLWALLGLHLHLRELLDAWPFFVLGLLSFAGLIETTKHEY